ncbi:MAG: hypothetical protein ACK4FY_03675 [Aquificaceae bacterium]
MKRIEVGSNKALAFILGLAYGYKNADIELKVFSIEDFSEDKHKDDKIYYISRMEGKVYDRLSEDVSHVCVLKEDKINGKVRIFIYKKLVK